VTFISPERRQSGVEGTGIQYVPGHEEPFVDHIVAQYLPATGRIVELGGAGFRFALAAALAGRKVTVVDRDGPGLDLPTIVERVNANGKLSLDLAELAPLIDAREDDALAFLERERGPYDLVCAFRLIMYFAPPQALQLFRLAGAALAPGGVFALSGMTPWAADGTGNEFHAQSDPIGADPLYRRFRDTDEARRLRRDQNQPRDVYFLDEVRIRELAAAAGLDVVETGLPSTRIMRGHVLRR
jgi:SAM-dependent methyltransferase